MRPAAILDLIRDGVQRSDTAWADFGSGDGAFTFALRELLSVDATIYSVDVDRSALKQQQNAVRSAPGVANIHFIHADFTQPLGLPPLDGVLLANALHFVEDQTAALQRIRSYLKPSGTLLIVEYDIDRGSIYVPHPVSFERLGEHTIAAGFDAPTLLATTPSRYWSRMYSAITRSAAQESDRSDLRGAPE